MAKTVTKKATRELRPATTPEAREQQLISLAVDLAEQQLRDGTASSQVITHFLKLGSTTARVEKELLELQKDLVTAKTDSLHANKKTDELYQEALEAMKHYAGKDQTAD